MKMSSRTKKIKSGYTIGCIFVCIVSSGLHNRDANHTGLPDFTGQRRMTFEGSVIYFLTDRLLLASEYRHKSDLCDPYPPNSRHLIMPESDWWDICMGYVVSDHLTIAGGYANFGKVLNHREDNVWAIQFKNEF